MKFGMLIQTVILKTVSHVTKYKILQIQYGRWQHHENCFWPYRPINAKLGVMKQNCI